MTSLSRLPVHTDSHHRAPCRWEWILKYCRTLTTLILLLNLVPAIFGAPAFFPQQKTMTKKSQPAGVHQSYCWNEYDDLSSRAFASPVVVRGLAMVIYSRGTQPQYNATFYVTDILKSAPSLEKTKVPSASGGRKLREYLENNPKIQLNFGLMEEWTVFPESAVDIQQENLLRGQSCGIGRVDLQKEYLLFLRPRDGGFESDADETVDNNVFSNGIHEEDKEIGGAGAVTWSIFAAPEAATPLAIAAAQKGLRQGEKIL